MGLYVYGLMRSAEAPENLELEYKDHALRVETVVSHDLCALVSVVPDEAVKLRRRSLLAHSEVLRRALDYGPVLPLRFGTVVADEAAVGAELIAPRAEYVTQRLAALDGKVEMQIKASYLEAQILRKVLAEDPPLARAAERIRGLPDAVTHFERIRLGELIAQAVTARAEAESHAIVESLRPVVVAVTILPSQHERMALNAAFLVVRERLGEFDRTVERLSDEHAGHMEFKLIGPLPAHSFADREWEKEPAWA